MRQRCGRVLGSYDYIKELIKQQEIAEKKLNAEQVVKGKLNYLSKMFAEIDVRQTESFKDQNEVKWQQLKVEKLLRKIGETSEQSDLLMFQIGQLARKFDDTEYVKKKVEYEFNVLTAKAKKLNIAAIISQEELLLKTH